jgi:hypothetical protein
MPPQPRKHSPLNFPKHTLSYCSRTATGIPQNHGIQIYLDMTKSIGKKYEDEFVDVIRSITEK